MISGFGPRVHLLARERSRLLSRRVMAAIDVLVMTLAFVLAYLVRFDFALDGAHRRELAAFGSSDAIRAYLGAFLPEAQMNGGLAGADGVTAVAVAGGAAAAASAAASAGVAGTVLAQGAPSPDGLTPEPLAG